MVSQGEGDGDGGQPASLGQPQRQHLPEAPHEGAHKKSPHQLGVSVPPAGLATELLPSNHEEHWGPEGLASSVVLQ